MASAAFRWHSMATVVLFAAGTLASSHSIAGCPINFPAQKGAPEGPVVKAIQSAAQDAFDNRPFPPPDVYRFVIVPDESAALAIVTRLNRLSDDDCAAPYYAAMFGFNRVLARLLDIKADLYAVDGWLGMTPLMAAAYYGQLATVRLLVERKAANINEKSGFRIGWSGGHGPSFPSPSGGETALMWAAREGHENVVRYLLDNGANMNQSGWGGVTALRMARFGRHESIIELLQTKGAKE